MENLVGSKLLRKDGELRSILIHSDVGTAHAAIAVEGGTTMEDSVIIEYCKYGD
jgi:hypothetical protein